MNCNKDNSEIIDYVNGQMSVEEREQFEMHIKECASCREELNAQQQLWDMLGKIPVPMPSSRLDQLDPITIQRAQPTRIWMKIAAVFILVIAGFTTGYLVNRSGASYAYKQQVDSLSREMHDMREIMMLSLLENPSASERIRAVGYTSEINQVNAKIVDALLTTLNNDPNVNVRLMTLEALTHYAGNAAVREGLVLSIVQQDSPLVQSAMADVMLKMQEKKSIQPFKKLLEQKELNTQIRTKIEQTISRLI